MKALQVNSDHFTQADFFESDASDLFDKAERFSAYLDDWKGKDNYAYHRMITSSCQNRVMVRDPHTGKDRNVVALISNNYLGLNMRPEVISAAEEALARFGSGMCGSRFLSGTYDIVVQLEQDIAAYECCEDAMVFTTGYQANVGAISAIMRHGDVVYIDRLCHASIVDGCRLAGCTYRAFKHNDPEHLDMLLKKTQNKYKGKLVVVDGVFSMDGDMAPLPELLAVAEKYGARIMVDEAHGTGVVGPHGHGVVEHFNMQKRVDLVIGTFSKTLAATGGFLAGTSSVINYVRHYGRSYIFSASPIPVVAASVKAGLTIINRESEPREKLWYNIHYFHRGLRALGFEVYPDPPCSAILTIKVGSDVLIREMNRDVYRAGVYVGSAAYPAVPRNESIFRFSLSALHETEDLDFVIHVMSEVGKKYQLI